MKAVRSALIGNEYECWVTKIKVVICAENHKTIPLNSAHWGLTWSPGKLYNTSFSDEVWTSGGAYSRSFVAFLVEGGREESLRDWYHPGCLIRKWCKLPSWMFYWMIHNLKKTFRTFWEKRYGETNSMGYGVHTLSKIEVYFRNERAYGRWSLFQHDNALCHRSSTTNKSLQRREIPTIKRPPYSPDLNPTEHVLVGMEKIIHDDYRRNRYEPQRIPLINLWALIQAA